jgi:hypothetical protein
MFVGEPLRWSSGMTPREVMHDPTATVGRQFSSRELLLHGRPNYPASVFFACIALLHLFIAIHALSNSIWEASVSAFLAACFLFVAWGCLRARNQITIRPQQQQIHLHGGLGRFCIDRDIPFSAVRAVRVTLWQSRRRSRSRLEILCDGEEIPCPPTTIPRQQALYLALVMNVRLIKVSDRRFSRETMTRRSW